MTYNPDDKYLLRLPEEQMKPPEQMSRAERRRLERDLERAGLDPDDKSPENIRKKQTQELVTRLELMSVIGRYNEVKIIPLAYELDVHEDRLRRLEAWARFRELPFYRRIWVRLVAAWIKLRARIVPLDTEDSTHADPDSRDSGAPVGASGDGEDAPGGDGRGADAVPAARSGE